MEMIPEQDKVKIKEMLATLPGPVKIISFTQELECQYCRETTELMKEVSELSDKISHEVYNFINDKEKAEEYKVQQTPATIITNGEDRGVRYYGIPSGYEFATLLETIRMFSSGESGLSPDAKTFLGELKEEVKLQVFITPACPYCPRSVMLAYRFAYESPMVKADGIEAMEFPELSSKFAVRNVPKTFINGSSSIEGAAPESMLIENIKEAIK
jgi:glutaredoxin-like protein